MRFVKCSSSDLRWITASQYIVCFTYYRYQPPVSNEMNDILYTWFEFIKESKPAE